MKKNIFTIIMIILAGVVVFAVVQGIRTSIVSEKSSSDTKKQVEKTEVSKESEEFKESVEEVQKPSKTESELKLQARAFIQIYGTYSSDSGYANLVGLLDFMNDKLHEQTQSRIDSGIDQSQGFFSKVTKVGSIETLSFIKDSKALFTAQTQIQETRKSQTNLSQQIVDIIYFNIDGKWKVDSIEFR